MAFELQNYDVFGIGLREFLELFDENEVPEIGIFSATNYDYENFSERSDSDICKSIIPEPFQSRMPNMVARTILLFSRTRFPPTTSSGFVCLADCANLLYRFFNKIYLLPKEIVENIVEFVAGRKLDLRYVNYAYDQYEYDNDDYCYEDYIECRCNY